MILNMREINKANNVLKFLPLSNESQRLNFCHFKTLVHAGLLVSKGWFSNMIF